MQSHSAWRQPLGGSYLGCTQSDLHHLVSFGADYGPLGADDGAMRPDRAASATRCRACHHCNQAGATQCAVCGVSLIRAPAERKQVTILFADVTRSVGLSASLGPEEWWSVIGDLFDLLRAGVKRFDGSV